MSDEPEQVIELSEEDQHLIRKEVKDEEQKNRQQAKTCMVCGKKAEYCMRGIPKNTYCKECALDYFKFLHYLESLK